ncbi:protein HESO1-like [Vicia villosa]|uniref:protein HESO1-like n=1 Tax=Vicia villosa TaxID=3911 RepID=UPI00273B1FEF|nr:protein HESO1-like [Vicia villosa]XP_058730098.1 protein HESO1-like [Vicia villosa]XP_058730099.1 protein HESO1-like [Vicia villosa]XP_058730100.1 protein HESO1-like [Vicia villosa]
MNTHNMLGVVLNDILHMVTPSREDWEIRLAIISDLRSTVESVESLRGATVEPFGSFVSNLFTRWGDLDISIELLNGTHIASAGKKQKQTLLVNFLKVLRMKGGCMNIQLIPHARVPILKFKSVRQGISCDVSINNLPGLMKSKFLLWISKIDDRFHDLVLVVKQWANAHKINNSKTGSFNSFSLSLLVIFHFQTCVPAIFPPLKDIYPTNMVDELRGVRVDAENLISGTCNANIDRFKSNKSRPINRTSLPELFIDFLRKFALIDTWAAEFGVCTYTGQWEQIENNMRWLPKTSAIYVEDPFEQPENSARSVSAGQLKKIGEAFLTTYNLLISNNQNQSSILTQLVPPHVSRLIAGPVNPYYNVWPSLPNYNGGYPHLTQPQVQKGVLPHPQSKRRVRNGRQGASSNGSTSKQGANSNGSTSKQGANSKGSTSNQGANSNGSTSKQGASSNSSTSKQGASSNGLTSKQGASSNGSTSKQGATSDGSTSKQGASSNGPTSSVPTKSRQGPPPQQAWRPKAHTQA